MNISVSLRRGPDGNLRPNMPNPTTPAQAKAFNEAMKTAKEADALLDQFTELADDLKKLDNGEQDFNTDLGVVATSGHFKSSDSRDSLEQSQVLSFDPGSGDVSSVSRSIEGTVFRSTKRETSTSGRNYTFQQTDSYAKGPLLSLQAETTMSIPDDSSRFLKSTASLNETSEGVFTYDVTEMEQNIFEK